MREDDGGIQRDREGRGGEGGGQSERERERTGRSPDTQRASGFSYLDNMTPGTSVKHERYREERERERERERVHPVVGRGRGRVMEGKRD